MKLPYVNLPDNFTRLLVNNIQQGAQANTNLEVYINQHRELNLLVKKLFVDIDPDGFLGKIINVVGFSGIRNRLACAYLDYARNGNFPDKINLNSINDIINLENKLRHFTPAGYSRAFLLGFYAQMVKIELDKKSETHHYSPIIFKDSFFEFLKYSKSKSIRIDWLFLNLLLMESVLTEEKLLTLLKNSTPHNAIMALMSPDEKLETIESLIAYSSSIFDYEIFLKELNH